MAERLLLVGCGHAHLFVLEALAKGRLPGYEATLVSPDDEYFYSGMISGVVAGCYRPEDARFRPPLLARAAGAPWVRGRVERIDPERRQAVLADGSALHFDLLSLDIGSRLAGDDLPGVRETALPLKPVRRALDIVARAESALDRSPSSGPGRIVVVGGGAAGVEIALCLAARLGRRPGRPDYRVAVLESADRVLAEHSPRLRSLASGLLDDRGVEVIAGVRVGSAGPGWVRDDSGAAYACDLLVWATGPRAPGLVRRSGLPADGRGYLLVDRTLRAVGHPHIFGSGDCVVLEAERWVPRAGVYAVRQGPVLVENLARLRDRRPLRSYRPQRDWLSLINTGDGRAVAAYRAHSYRGRAAWWLKDWIDRRFMSRFRRLERPD